MNPWQGARDSSSSGHIPRDVGQLRTTSGIVFTAVGPTFSFSYGARCCSSQRVKNKRVLPDLYIRLPSVLWGDCPRSAV